MKIIGVIPARLGSTRLHEKVLKLIHGRPMIQHVWERVRQAGELAEVIVACDDARVETCVLGFGGKAALTSKEHPNGSSRVAEIASRFEADIFINIQGDEPMIHPSGIDELARAMRQDSSVQVATLAVPRTDREDYENPNVVKVVRNQNGDALYFSRSPLPYYRDSAAGPVSYLKHLGIYGYRRNFLLQFVGWKTSSLEAAEKLEQLRILEKGFPIRVLETPYDSFSVDTAEDLQSVEQKMKNLREKKVTGVI
ncbi:MAG: 3-deoxy-manno-octulosonate cytidylyltransferase [Candidatus Omnitrophica bacterium]|nr:3-deoxy-manno-octulosonate cytidylyltransferase [Candidatus Omnitrophota bacterium]